MIQNLETLTPFDTADADSYSSPFSSGTGNSSALDPAYGYRTLASIKSSLSATRRPALVSVTILE